ncbi:MAG: hypothetical protein ACWA5R_12395 [bacterium]
MLNLTRNMFILIVLLVSNASFANPPSFQIDPDCVASGCFAGDNPGFPVELTKSGVYVLTGNLVLNAVNTAAISGSNNYITLDLNGFSIIGAAQCQGAPVTGCSTSSTATGVDLSASGNIVKNGMIIGFGSGIQIGKSGRVEDMYVKGNSGTGINCYDDCEIENVTSTENLLQGILCQHDCLLQSVIMTYNGGNGARGSSVRAYYVVSSWNGVAGIDFGLDNTLTAVVTRHNAAHGLSLGSGAISRVISTSNAGAALDTQNNSDLIVHDSVLVKSAAGVTINGTGFNQTGNNQCDTDLVCP